MKRSELKQQLKKARNLRLDYVVQISELHSKLSWTRKERLAIEMQIRRMEKELK